MSGMEVRANSTNKSGSEERVVNVQNENADIYPKSVSIVGLVETADSCDDHHGNIERRREKKKVNFAATHYVLTKSTEYSSPDTKRMHRNKKLRNTLAKKSKERYSKQKSNVCSKYCDPEYAKQNKKLKLPTISYTVIREATADSVTRHGVPSVSTDFRLPKLNCTKYKAMGLPILRSKWTPETSWNVPECVKLGNIKKSSKRFGEGAANTMDSLTMYGPKFVDRFSVATTIDFEMPPPLSVPSSYTDPRYHPNTFRERSIIRKEHNPNSIRQYARDKAMLPSVYGDFFFSKTRQNLYISSMFNEDMRNTNNPDPLCSKYPFLPDDSCQYCDVLGRKYCRFCTENKNRQFAHGFETNVLPTIENDKLTANLVAPRLSNTLLFRAPLTE